MAAFGLFGWAVRSARGSRRHGTSADPPPAERPAHLGSWGDRGKVLGGSGRGARRRGPRSDLSAGWLRSVSSGGPGAPRAAQRVTGRPSIRRPRSGRPTADLGATEASCWVGQGEERSDGALPLTAPRDGCVRSLRVGRALRARLNASRDERRSAARGAAGPPRTRGRPLGGSGRGARRRGHPADLSAGSPRSVSRGGPGAPRAGQRVRPTARRVPTWPLSAGPVGGPPGHRPGLPSKTHWTWVQCCARLRRRGRRGRFSSSGGSRGGRGRPP